MPSPPEVVAADAAGRTVAARIGALTVPARLVGLDGLRAIAVTLVVVYHLFPRGWLRGGFVGVDEFFVISGFLITTLLLRERARFGRVRLGEFWRRRARRLLPALTVVLLVCSAAAWLVGGDVLVRLGAQVLGALTFSYNWVAISIGEGYFSSSSPELFRNLWSLGIEEQFYLLWPLVLPLVALLPRTRLRVGVVAAAASASAVWMGVLVVTSGDVSRAYYGTDSHAFGILLGVALAFVFERLHAAPPPWMLSAPLRRGVEVVGGLAVVGVVLVATLPPTDTVLTFPLTLAAASALTAVAIAAGVWPGSRLGTLLDAAPLRWVGERSYGLYLWHWPLLVLAVAVVSGAAPEAGVPFGISMLVLASTLTVATLSYRYLETPIRRNGFRQTWRNLRREVGIEPAALWGTVAGGLVTAVLLAGALAAIVAAPQPTGEGVVADGQAALDEANANPTGPATDASAPPQKGTSGVFADGATRRPAPEPTPIAGSQVSAVGDSVMLAAAPALLEELPGIRIDAAVSRSSWAGPGIVEQFANTGELGAYLVVALGTNGSISTDAYERMAALAGPDRGLVLVNAYGPRDWIPGVNDNLIAFAATHPNTVVADWASAIDPHPDFLAGDHIHPGPSGGRIYADTVTRALNQIENARAIGVYLDHERAFRLAHSDQARIAQ